MSNDAKVTFAGNADALLAEHKKIEEANQKEIKKLKELLAESRKTYSEENKLLREKQVALDNTRSAQQVYNDQMQKWFNLMAQGKLTLEQFNRLKTAEKQKLDEATAAQEKARLAQERLTKATQAGNTEAATAGNRSRLVADGFAFMAAKALVAVAAIKNLAETQKQMRSEAAGTVANIDDLSRDYAIQGGLKTEEQRKEAVVKIMEVARANASNPNQAFSTASQLASSGFDAPTGESLDSALKIIKTSDMAKSDPKGYIDAAAKFLKASNQKLTGKNLLEIGVAMRGLVDTPVQASDLAEFSEAAPILNMQGVDWKTGLGMMTELRRAFSGATAGTKMRNIAQRLAIAGTDKQAVEALGDMGLKAEDVDAIGESMPEALRRVGAAVEKMPQAQRAGAMGRLFNNENVAAADVLIKNIDAVDKNVKAMSDSSLFVAGVNFQLQGHNAQIARSDIDLQNEQLKNQDEVTRKTILSQEIKAARVGRQRTQTKVESVIQNMVTNPIDDIALEMGLQSEDAVLRNAERGFRTFDDYGIGLNREQRQKEDEARRKRLDKSGEVFTAEQLKARRDPQMDEQTQVLKELKSAIADPANRPVVNPVTRGRTDK